ncbi:MAG: hypothetical protein EOP49_10120 [Sphingobacteriales bacterium]|nr:MAG: hypothetical protein EOP49_10120 [Sphingobacteriales bacterium]
MMELQTWTPDEGVYNELQGLHDFIAFLESEFILRSDQQECAVEIHRIITAFTIPPGKNFTASLNLFDDELRSLTSTRKGTYWRSWSIRYEQKKLEVEVKSRTTPAEFHAGHFEFYYRLDLNDGSFYDRDDIQRCIADMKNYKNYITEGLAKVTVELEAWN